MWVMVGSVCKTWNHIPQPVLGSQEGEKGEKRAKQKNINGNNRVMRNMYKK